VLEPRLTGPVLGALFVPTDLQCDPQAIARGLAAAAAGHGAEIRTHAEVEAIDPGTGVRLRNGEQLRAAAVVLAAGPWSGPLAATAGLQLPLEPRKGQLTRLRMARPNPGFLQRKVVDGSYMLSVGSADPGRQISTVVETTWDGYVVVGSTRERCGFDPSVDHELASAVRARAARLVPELTQLDLDATWVGFRPWLPDHLPAIGPTRKAPALWVGAGHEGAGVILGPITGRLLAQAITGETPSIDPSPFDPDRFAYAGSAPASSSPGRAAGR
jgi:glycine/D-amino acid oxidase-like deaminating enzyme